MLVTIGRLKAAAAALACTLMVGTAGLASAKPAGEAATVAIDLEHPGPTIDPAVYGQFSEHLGNGIYPGIWVGPDSPIPNTNGYRNDVVAALKHLHVPVLRWPGGCFADQYDWRDGIGPRAKRPVRVNVSWGGVEENNAFGTNEFMDFAELIGAEAYISGNMGSMEPRAMAQWVEYMTSPSHSTLAEERRANGRDKPWHLKYLGFGNETWGCGGNMTAETSAMTHRRFQSFVSAASQNGPMVRVASGASGDDYAFTDTMMRLAADQMDAISLHYYTLRGDWEKKGGALGFDDAGWAKQIEQARRMDAILTGHSKVMDKYDPKKRVGLFVDEWGNWFDSDPKENLGVLYQQNSLLDAVTAATTLNIFHRHSDRVRLGAIAQMINVLQAMILTDGSKMVLTPTYHVFDMYQPFMGATPYPVTIQSPTFQAGGTTLPMVDATAARGKDGKLWLALVNADPERAAQVRLGAKGSVKGRVLTGDRIDAHNTFDHPNTVAPQPFAQAAGKDGLVVSLPAKSVVVVEVDQR